MGKGTKHKCDWKPTKLDAAIAAMKLHAHTAKILGNPKVFLPSNDFHNRTLLEAFEATLEIYRRCYEANEINVDENPSLARERLFQQQMAMVAGRWLQAVEGIIKSQFHVDSNKFWNWAEMTENTLKKIKAWHEGDKKRYGAIAARVPEEDFSRTGGNGSRLMLGGLCPPALC